MTCFLKSGLVIRTDCLLTGRFFPTRHALLGTLDLALAGKTHIFRNQLVEIYLLTNFQLDLRMTLGNVPLFSTRMHYQWYKPFLIVSIILIFVACFLVIVTLFSPQWQLLDITELNAYHEHGVWWDCVSSGLIPLDMVDNYGPGSRRKCTQKFDPAVDAVIKAAVQTGSADMQELLLHRLLPQDKAVLFFTIFSVLFSMMAVVIGACTSCFVPNSVLYSIALLIATICSGLADVIFFLASMRIDNRFVTGIVNVYEQQLGWATYAHGVGTLIFFTSFAFSIASAYFLLRNSVGSVRDSSSPAPYSAYERYDYEPYKLNQSTPPCHGEDDKTCTYKDCPQNRYAPFVVITDV
ncbi:hypothetical protein L596_012227 [Steinernema carpocapsae]|uniref:Clc-like protein n=1 Tax=Steinernema carpocapsae TaxID=34508 RepID=A0A4U5NWC5_STECR|nr:hypothetical protein L596_012227 [Steinernema carpocapsae]